MSAPSPDGGRARRRRDRARRPDPQAVVPAAAFTSYYGRPVVKAAPWENDIPAYLFLGGLAAGSSVLGAGGDLTGRPVLRRAGRVGALAAVLASFGALVHDLGRPERFHHMLRVAKPTSPMSMGTWILTGYGPLAGLAAASEAAGALPRLPRRLRRAAPLVGRVAGLGAAGLAPALASYTAVLLSDTAVPAWHDAYDELPFVFVGSAAAAAGGVGLLAPLAESGPARRLAVTGAFLELASAAVLEGGEGLSGRPYRIGHAGRLTRTAAFLISAGGALAAVSGRSRPLSALAGLALLSGSACSRFGVFEAGRASARDPAYTVVPQRARLEEGRAARAG